MGNSSYYSESRSIRSATLGLEDMSMDTLKKSYGQTKERKAHETMLPNKMKGFREARDSANHPKTIPIQIYLDVTGSMLNVPLLMIQNGMPHIMETMLEAGLSDISLMFGAIGDHEYDTYPLQIGQFESGDEELDLWLQRTFLESGGGGNAGESYGLAWLMAKNFVKTDAWEKRGEKSFLFTIGDEPALLNYPASALKEIFGSNLTQPQTYTIDELYNSLQEQYHVFHLNVGHHGRNSRTNLKSIMGQNCIDVNDYRDIPKIITDITLSHVTQRVTTGDSPETLTKPSSEVKDEGPEVVL